MTSVKLVLMLTMLFLATACSSGSNAPKAEQTKGKSPIQDTVDSFIQPRINVLDKAKGLEGTLKAAEEKRLERIEGFELNGQ